MPKKQVKVTWPTPSEISGFELHHGRSEVINLSVHSPQPLCNEDYLGWISKSPNARNVAGTYLHGIFDNGTWRRSWMNLIRCKKGIAPLPLLKHNHSQSREKTINLLADVFEEHIDLGKIINS